MEPLSLSNKLILEWGTYLAISALFLTIFFLTKKSSDFSLTVAKKRKALEGSGIMVVDYLIPLLLLFIIITFVALLLYRNQRIPTLEGVLPILLLLSPTILILIFSIKGLIGTKGPR